MNTTRMSTGRACCLLGGSVPEDTPEEAGGNHHWPGEQVPEQLLDEAEGHVHTAHGPMGKRNTVKCALEGTEPRS